MASDGKDVPLNSSQLPSCLTASGCLKVAVMEINTVSAMGVNAAPVVASRFTVDVQEVVSGKARAACRIFEVDGEGRVLRVVAAPLVRVSFVDKFILLLKNLCRRD
jgi:hypothetical protein